MNIKIRLQQMLQILEDAERNGALSDIERDILLADLREAYAELKFGTAESAETPATPIAPVAPLAEVAELEKAEVEVEIIFDEDEECEPTSEEVAETNDDDFPDINDIPEVDELLSEIEKSAESEEVVEEATENIAENVAGEEPTDDTGYIDEVKLMSKEDIADFLRDLGKQRNALLSLYEDEPTPILGEQFHETPSVADTIACPKGIAESAPVASLREAIGVADRFMLIGELFDGDAEAYDKAISVLEAQPSLEDAMIYIAENYTWSPNATATKFVMELLNRKYN